MFGSFIQSHWPCMTLWPISMFSRILATESPAVPSTHAGLNRENSSTIRDSAASRRCNCDHVADVAGVGVAEVVEHLVVQFVELLADLLELLLAELVQRVGRVVGRGGSGGHGASSYRSISTWPSGALMQTRTIWPLASVIAPVRRSRTAPSLSRPTQVWQMPIRQPNGELGAGLLAADEDRHPGVALGLAVGHPEMDGAAGAVPAAVADHRLEPFGVQVLGTLGLSRSASSTASMSSRGPERNDLALAPVRAVVVEVGRARSACRREVCTSMQPVALVPVVPSGAACGRR